MKFACPHCKRNISVTSAECGKQATCPHEGCRELIRVPFAEVFAKQEKSKPTDKKASTVNGPHPLQETSIPPPVVKTSTSEAAAKVKGPASASDPEPELPKDVPNLALPTSKRGRVRLRRDLETKKEQFMESDYLEPWEYSLLKSFQLNRKIQFYLNTVLSLLALNLVFRILLLVAKPDPSTMELVGLYLIPVLAIVAKLKTNLWTVVPLAVVIFATAPGFISGILAAALLFLIPRLLETSKLLPLSRADRRMILRKLGAICDGKVPGFFRVGQIVDDQVWAGWYENQAVFFSAKKVLNLISPQHLSKLEFGSRKGLTWLIKWPNEKGKPVSAKVELSMSGFRELREWSVQ